MKTAVAIDGPASSGKSTVAKIVADKLNFEYINTGAMYRAITLIALENNIKPEDNALLIKMADSLEMHFEKGNLIVDGENLSGKLSTVEIGKNVSFYSEVPEIREILVKIQRNISLNYNVVMDGRDIGTHVLKNAKYKFFLTADAKERAKRRYKELKDKKVNVIYDDILSDIIKRDYIDSHRKINPLKKADDAVEIDTTNLSIDMVADKILSAIQVVID